MRGATIEMVEVGEYVVIIGHRVQPRFSVDWMKAVAIEGNDLHLVDREGASYRFPRNRRIQDARAQVWEPGDPKRYADR